MNELFCKDFINLQSQIKTMPKDKSGYGYKYTDLDTIISNLKPLLKANNFGFIQMLKTMYTDNGKVTGIDTCILHSSGENVSSFVEIPEIQVGKANNAQNIGAAISYFKRYALAAAFGISSDEDIDCSSQALESHNRASQTAPTVKASSNKKSDNTSKNINQKFTKEQGEILKSLLETTLKDGTPIFEKSEIDTARNMFLNGEFEKAKEIATAKIDACIAADIVKSQMEQEQTPIF